VKVELLQADLDELEPLGIRVEDAFARGSGAVLARTVRDAPTEPPGTERGLAELVDLYAETAADMRLLRFSYALRQPGYRRSRSRYDAVESQLAEASRKLAPSLRARLRHLRGEEARLEAELRALGIDPSLIGPHVPQGRAIDPSVRPGEHRAKRRALAPLPPRRSWLERLRRRAGPR